MIISGGWHGSRVLIFNIAKIEEPIEYGVRSIGNTFVNIDHREYWNHGCIILDVKKINIGVSVVWYQVTMLLFGGWHNNPFKDSFLMMIIYFPSDLKGFTQVRPDSSKRVAKTKIELSKTPKTKLICIDCERQIRFEGNSKNIGKYFGFSVQKLSSRHYLLFGGCNNSFDNYTDSIYSLEIVENCNNSNIKNSSSNNDGLVISDTINNVGNWERNLFQIEMIVFEELKQVCNVHLFLLVLTIV